MNWFSKTHRGDTPQNPAPHASAQAKRNGWQNLTIDLNRPKHRLGVLLGFLGANLLLVIFLVGSYQTYQFTESAEFCGTTCHPMKSEFVRYEKSAHAKVECAKCHIGPGASFFVKSKIDGLKQVYAVLADTYSRPIKGPVHNLRPARETCEECHTPTSYKDNIIKTIRHYDNDKANTPLQSTVILKMGGWQESTGMSEGIHWHITNPVYYIAADEQRQSIMWVGAEQKDGSLKEFYARDMLNMDRSAFIKQARAEGKVRIMDCIDCHNRAAHFIPSPEALVDEAITNGLIPTDLPFIRSKAVEVLGASYPNEAAAYAAIDGLADFYRMDSTETQASLDVVSNSPAEVSAGPDRITELDSVLAELKRLYSSSNFPDMGLNWRTNPNHARHSPFPGCFRCHDGKHVNVDQAGNETETISVKCNLCHTVPIVGRGNDMLVETPVIVGTVPSSHSDFRWTVEHRSITAAERQECYNCHGQGFCNNGACHNLSHPSNMVFTHANEYRKHGDQVCYTCHQDVLCSRCHPDGIVTNP